MRQYNQVVTEAKKKIQRPSDIEIIPLNFDAKQVKPVMSKDTLDLHYDKLAKGYAKRYNEKEVMLSLTMQVRSYTILIFLNLDK